MILFNGSSGSLGAYLGPALSTRGLGHRALKARLEARAELEAELDSCTDDCRRDGWLVLLQLAALVSVPACERKPKAAFRTNVVHTLSTVRSVCEFGLGLGCRVSVVYVSSGHVYAAQPASVRLSEQHPTGPRSVYANTKLQAESGVQELCDGLGVRSVIARVFGLVAPRQPDNYVLPGMFRRVRERQLSAVPGLSFARDYLDARDVCECLLDLALVEDDEQQLVNVCSGRPVKLRELVELIIDCVRPAEKDQLLSELGEAPARPDDVPWIVGDPSRASALLGRDLQRIPLLQTVKDAAALLSG